MTREEIRVMPFDWNDNMSEIAQEDFSLIQKSLSYGTAQTIGMALAKLELLEKQGCKVGSKAEQKWIPVSERLPEDGDTYLVTIEYRGEVIGVDVASYSPVDGYIDKHWETFNDWKEDDDSCYHVTAWMPLPSSYQGEE